jgi:hypothetical protein
VIAAARIGLLGASMLLTMPDAVQAEAPEDAALADYRELTRVAPRRNNCAAGESGDEIVVCGRRRDNLRYRLPPSPPAPGTRAAQSVHGERFALQQNRTEGGSGSCSTVGPNGLMGCVTHRLRDAQENGDPGLVARALTYLDPDE